MGLCKCPKKKVTNLFCFEHKVNVCEHCLVENHEKCIVKSYLQWLEDSDYNPNCPICEKLLKSDGDCIRLMCYDVFHLVCLNSEMQKLPETTAPAGYECYACNKQVVPQANVAGPVAEKLRKQLSEMNWYCRAFHISRAIPMMEASVDNFEIVMDETKPYPVNMVKLGVSNGDDDAVSSSEGKDHSVYQIPDTDEQVSSIRKSVPLSEFQLPNIKSSSATNQKSSTDDNWKYTRKPIITHFLTLIKNYIPLSTTRRSPQQAYRYFILTVILCVFLFLLLLWSFSVLGHYSSDNDPMLDPRYNPNIAVFRENMDKDKLP